jgi:signal transduction histidine kinase
MIDAMSPTLRTSLILRWTWLATMVLVAAASRPPGNIWVVLGLSGALLVWLSVTALQRPDQVPSKPWLLGIDLALGVGLVLASDSWRSPFFSVWLLLGVVQGLEAGQGRGLRLASAGLLLSGLFLAAVQPPEAADLLTFSLLILGVLWGTWALIFLAFRIRPDAATTPAPGPADAIEDNQAWVLEAAASLGSAGDETQIVERALDLALAGALSPGAASPAALLLADQPAWSVRGARRLSAADRTVTLDEPVGLLAAAIAAGQAVVSRDPAGDPGLAGMSAFSACREVACVPLLRGGAPRGALLIGWTSVPASSGALRSLEAVGRLTSSLLEGLDRLRRSEAERQRQGDVQEESRRRLARDLHDGPTQAIASLAMRLNYIGRMVDRDPAAARTELTTAEEMARRATGDIRHMLFALRPLILESQGLVPALWQLGQKVREAQGELVLVEAERDEADGMPPLQQSITFYIAEEGINNAVKHAQARHIWVRLKAMRSGWRLQIEDDGVGFNVGAVDENYAQRGSLGLVSMRERAALAGGQLSIDSREGRGTRIEVLLPRPAEPPDPDVA